MTTNVFIVDDSATARTALRLILETSDDINVIGVASTPIIALKRMQKTWPDVIISDLEMPDMSGFEFLEYLQQKRPTPFIVFSNYTGSSAMSSVEALAKGALDIIPKPNFNCEESLQATSNIILNSIRAAAKLAVKMEVDQLQRKNRKLTGKNSRKMHTPVEKVENYSVVTNKKYSDLTSVENEDEAFVLPRQEFSLLALGSSTGGTTIIEKILRELTVKSPAVVVVQHMPEHFTQAFAKRINQFCRIHVKEACDGDEVNQGTALIAPGGKHMKLINQGGRLRVHIFDDDVVNSHKPSVDVLFHSIASLLQKDGLGVILTGMGKDGARGLLAMREAGAVTLSQSGEDCAVNGMPKAAVALGAVDFEMSSANIALTLSKLKQGRQR